MVEERNWLDVYPYQSWGGNANLPPLAEGQTFTPTELLLKEVRVRARACARLGRGGGGIKVQKEVPQLPLLLYMGGGCVLCFHTHSIQQAHQNKRETKQTNQKRARPRRPRA